MVDSEFSWWKVLEALSAPVSGLVAFIFGRATKGAANQIQLHSTTARVSALETQMTAILTTLASHNTLHEGYARTLDGIQRELKDLNTNVSRLTGVLQGPAPAIWPGRSIT